MFKIPFVYEGSMVVFVFGFNVRFQEQRQVLCLRNRVLNDAIQSVRLCTCEFRQERLSMHDMKEVLAVFSKALEELKAEGGHSQHIPVIYLDGIGDNLNQWQVGPLRKLRECYRTGRQISK